MQRRVTVLVSCALVAISTAAQAQAPGWYASAEILALTTHGNDVHVGDVIAADVTIGGSAPDLTESVVETFSPIAPAMDRTASFLVEAGHHGTAWGFGGRLWRVSADASAADTAMSAAGGPGVVHPTSVRLWNLTFLPAPDIFDPSGLTPIDYETRNGLEHIRVEGYAERAWLQTPALSVVMRFGLAYARSANTRAERLSMQSAITLFTLDDALTSSSETTFNLEGPLVGLSGDTAVGRVRLDWLISASALVGTAHANGTFDAVETARTNTNEGIVTSTTITRRSLRTSDHRRALVPAIDLELKASYGITRAIDIGAGIFTSSLFDLPVAPEFDAQASAWNRRASDIAFLAYSAFASVRF